MREMSIAGRMTICNMAVEMGAKNGIVEPDATTKEFLQNRVKDLPDFAALKSDKDAVYAQTLSLTFPSWSLKLHAPHP